MVFLWYADFSSFFGQLSPTKTIQGDLLKTSEGRARGAFKIRGIWAAEVSNQGVSGVLNGVRAG
jgi:hypothetical protein